MELVKEIAQSEYGKIRKLLIAQIFKAGAEPMRLASCREIAKDFGVTHTTVARAMKDLVADGYIIVKPGVGSFTNPDRRNESGVKVFGLFFADGKTAFLSRTNFQLANVLCDSLLESDESFRIQNGFLSTPAAQAEKEILKASLDGVVWILPSPSVVPALKRLREAGLPVVAATLGEPSAPEFCSFSFDYESDTFEVAKLMLSEGRRKIMHLLPRDEKDAKRCVAGLEKAHAEAGLVYDKALAFPFSLEDGGEVLKRVLNVAKPDGLIFTCGNAAPLPNLVRESGLDIVNGCRLFLHSFHLSSKAGYVGYVGEPQRSPAVGEAMKAQMELGAAAPVVRGFLPMKISMAGKKGER